MDKSIQNKRLEFLEETIKYYSEDLSRRSITGDQCMYRGSNGTKCAIGRHIPDEKYNSRIELHGVGSACVKDLLPEEILNLGINFLVEVQCLHDYSGNWNLKKLQNDSQESLSIEGLGKLEKLKQVYCQ